MTGVSIVDTTLDNISQFGVCGYKNPKKEGFPQKLDWLKCRFPEGLTIKTLVTEKDGGQGMIEYIPGRLCWRPVDAPDFLFIHCLFVGFKATYKNKGYASLLLDACEQDARKGGFKGVAVVTREGSFMAGKALFIKHGYHVVDTSEPDFELLVKKFSASAASPRFTVGSLAPYAKGLTIIRADQCPYTVKNVKEIAEAAQKEFGIKPRIVNLKSCAEAQSSPCAFGTFCMLYNGKVIADHPISKGRFVNIMKKVGKS